MYGLSLTDFASNLFAGIVGSVVTWIFVYASIRLSDRRKFSDYSGWYDQCHIDNTPIEKTRTHIQWLGKNIIKATCDGPEGAWVSHISLNEAVPDVGNGFYQYTSRLDCGIHQIQRAPDKSLIYVLVSNTSHGKYNTFAYLWKRTAH